LLVGAPAFAASPTGNALSDLYSSAIPAATTNAIPQPPPGSNYVPNSFNSGIYDAGTSTDAVVFNYTDSHGVRTTRMLERTCLPNPRVTSNPVGGCPLYGPGDGVDPSHTKALYGLALAVSPPGGSLSQLGTPQTVLMPAEATTNPNNTTPAQAILGCVFLVAPQVFTDPL
jgi:hypothetical protein